MTRIVLAALLLLAIPGVPAFAQSAAPPNSGDSFKDTSTLHAPAGARVAVIEYEDLECPACAHAFPIVQQAIAHYNIPYIRHDFPLPQHIWSFDAAVTARYIQDKINPKSAEDFRGAVFANQTAIASKEDLENFTRSYFQKHGWQMPFVMDPTGQFKREVITDRSLGERVGLSHTPSIFVVTAHHWTQVTDVSLLYQTIDTALAEAPAATKTVARRTHR
ncbi:DsbA family protein [Edaphobacter acidisoli]|nr:thioredoxin domain-containing protein [Edaphobacter acidisoli]